MYVAYEWLTLIFEVATKEQETLKPKPLVMEELTNIHKKTNNAHCMEYVFNHSQFWRTKDKTTGYVKFKFKPWYQNTELWVTELLLADYNATLEGQPTAWGPKICEMNKSLGLDGRGGKNA